MLKSVKIIVWTLFVQNKQKMNFKQIFSTVSEILNFNLFMQWNMQYFLAELTCDYVFSFKIKDVPDKCMFHSHLYPGSSVLSCCMVMQLLLDMLEMTMFKPSVSSLWFLWSPCRLGVTTLGAASIWARQGPQVTAAVLQLPKSLNENLSFSRDHHLLWSGNLS